MIVLNYAVCFPGNSVQSLRMSHGVPKSTELLAARLESACINTVETQSIWYPLSQYTTVVLLTFV